MGKLKIIKRYNQAFFNISDLFIWPMCRQIEVRGNN